MAGTVSVPLFGDSFFIGWYMYIGKNEAGFRPLIRGFFFYSLTIHINRVPFPKFPSPYSGILFLLALTNEQVSKIVVSVPLFGDSFFMTTTQN